MLNLQKRIKGVDENKKYLETRINIRERLLTEEVKELETNLKNQSVCRVTFPTMGVLHEMKLTIVPQEGFYKGGTYRFDIKVPHEYNNVPPVVKCLTKVWHPNINEDGAICLSLLRENSLDAYGWRPTRNITEVVHGLNALFTDLIDFDDPLNMQAAEQYQQNKPAFEAKVRDYIYRYARS